MKRIAFLSLTVLATSACRSTGVDYLEEVPPFIVDMVGVDGGPGDDGFVAPPDRMIFDDGFVTPPDRVILDDGFVTPPDRVILDDGFVRFDLARDAFPPPVDLARDAFPPPVDLARDAFPPPVDLARDAFQPDLPDFGMPDLVVPDLGFACVPGRHVGPLTGAIVGFPMTGTFDFTLGAPVAGVLPVTAGTMVASGPGNSIFNATLAGALDCGTRRLTGTIDNGVVTLNGQRFAYSGTWNGEYVVGPNNFVNGTWVIAVPQSPLGPLAGNGTWSGN